MFALCCQLEYGQVWLGTVMLSFRFILAHFRVEGERCSYKSLLKTVGNSKVMVFLVLKCYSF